MPKNYDNTQKAIDAVEKATKVALMAGIIDMHGQAVELTPVDTGNLKGSLSWTVGGEVGGVTSPATAAEGVNTTQDTDTAYLGTNVEYGPYIEYGTSKMAAQPYLIPAFDARKKYTLDIMKKHYQKALQGVKR